MNEVYEYAELEQRVEHGNWHFFMNGVRITVDFEEVSLINILNRLGKDGWQVVLSHTDYHWIIMKKELHNHE